MSSLSKNKSDTLERKRHFQTKISEFASNDNERKYPGHVDKTKILSNMRMTSLNVKGINSKNNKKVERFITSIGECK